MVPSRSRSLPRLTRRIFTDLRIWMVALGLCTGLAFPFFAVVLGVPADRVLVPRFFAATLGAGLFVSALNHLLARGVVGARLHTLSEAMRKVEDTLRAVTASGDLSGCDPERCRVPVDSDDELGDAARSFNALVGALAQSHHTNDVARRIAVVLSSHQELVPLAEASLRELTDATGLAAAAVCVQRDHAFEVAASVGVAAADDLVTSAPVETARRRLETVRVTVPDGVRLDAGVVRFPPRTVLAVPVAMQRVLIGVLVVASAEEIDAETQRTLELLAPNLAVALNNAMSYERLQRVAACDPLTGVYNRRFGLLRLTEEFERAVRSGDPLGVLLFDLDHFKMVNDVHGHQIGDQVLVAAAGAARRVLRDGDVLMRYGGEEFVAVLPGAGARDLAELGERIRAAVAEVSVPDGDQVLHVSVSLGAAAYPTSGVADVDDLLRAADEAMYRAKAAGRNRVVLAGPLPAPSRP